MADNEAYLIALAAIVNQQTELMRAENEQRIIHGFSPAFTMETHGLTTEAEILREALGIRK